MLKTQRKPGETVAVEPHWTGRHVKAAHFVYYLLCGFQRKEAFPAVGAAGNDLVTLTESYSGRNLSSGISSLGYVNQ